MITNLLSFKHSFWFLWFVHGSSMMVHKRPLWKISLLHWNFASCVKFTNPWQILTGQWSVQHYLFYFFHLVAVTIDEFIGTNFNHHIKSFMYVSYLQIKSIDLIHVSLLLTMALKLFTKESKSWHLPVVNRLSVGLWLSSGVQPVVQAL